jgi:ABC-type multidrug transport system permease subunit
MLRIITATFAGMLFASFFVIPLGSTVGETSPWSFILALSVPAMGIIGAFLGALWDDRYLKSDKFNRKLV